MWSSLNVFPALLIILASESSTVSGASSASSSTVKPAEKKKGGEGEGEESADNEEGVPGGPEGEDTMKNLRKTFAGIFGEMN